MFLVPVSCVWCAQLGHKFLVTSFWYTGNLGGEFGSCVIHLTLSLSLSLSVSVSSRRRPCYTAPAR